MKKIICILGSAIFLVLLVLPCFGISKAESDEIWKMKVEYDQTLSGYSENGLSYIQNPFYSSVDSSNRNFFTYVIGNIMNRSSI